MLPGLKGAMKAKQLEPIGKDDPNQMFPDTTNAMIMTGGLLKDKLTGLQANFKITQRGGGLLQPAEAKKNSYVAIKDQFKELRLRDRQSKINPRDLKLQNLDALENLKRLPKTQANSKSPSPIRAMSQLKPDGDIAGVIHGAEYSNRHRMQTIEPRGSYDLSIFHNTSRQISPPPRIDTLDGLLSMRESQDSLTIIQQNQK